jgi:hypothetical protein
MRFEESEMAKEFGKFDIDPRGMQQQQQHGPRRQQMPMMDLPPGMKGMPQNMPRGMMESMMHQFGDAVGPHGPLHDPKMWEEAFTVDREVDPEMLADFERFQREQPPSLRPHMPPFMQNPQGGPSTRGIQRPWAQEFEEEGKFAEFEQIYRT